MVETADIVVVGGGCIGLSVALHLAQSKAGKILLLEKKQLANGATGKALGLIRAHYTHPIVSELAQLAKQRFQEFKERYGTDESGFYPCGYYLLVGEEDVQTLRKVVQMNKTLGINIDLVEPREVQDRFPFVRLDDVALIACESDSGYGEPLVTMRSFAHRAETLGVEIRTDTPVTEIKLDLHGNVKSVVTEREEIFTPVVVDCVGAWAKKLTENLGLPFCISPVIEHVVAAKNAPGIAAMTPVISDLINLCYFRPDASNSLLRMCNSDPRYHTQCIIEDADDFHGQVFSSLVKKLQEKLLHRFPNIQASDLVEQYSCIWAVTPDYHPIIDSFSHIPGLYCAVGFSGHGYKLSPIVGELMSRWILGETNSCLINKLQLFRWNRFQENDLIKSPLTYSKIRTLR